jgi:hypothetical protein
LDFFGSAFYAQYTNGFLGIITNFVQYIGVGISTWNGSAETDWKGILGDTNLVLGATGGGPSPFSLSLYVSIERRFGGFSERF